MPPHTLDVVALFQQAGPVVKGTMIVLGLASIWCWTIIVRCLIGLAALRLSLGRLGRGGRTGLVALVEGRGSEEARTLYAGEGLGERRDRVAGAMRRQAQAGLEAAQKGLANLAVISSVTPFVGLFGTVWGIMTSFVGIAAAKDTSLAVVAPGIAEALMATALGLAAAIPAAFAYNRLAASFALVGRRLARHVEDRVSGLIADSDLAAGTETR